MSKQMSTNSSIGSEANSPGVSTQPSSPLTINSPDKATELEIRGSGNQQPGDSAESMDIAQDEDDEEGMDVKAKALTRLLKTSSVGLPLFSVCYHRLIVC